MQTGQLTQIRERAEQCVEYYLFLAAKGACKRLAEFWAAMQARGAEY